MKHPARLSPSDPGYPRAPCDAERRAFLTHALQGAGAALLTSALGGVASAHPVSSSAGAGGEDAPPEEADVGLDEGDAAAPELGAEEDDLSMMLAGCTVSLCAPPSWTALLLPLAISAGLHRLKSDN